NATSIVVLGRLLEKEGYILYYASSLYNMFFRLFDMIFKVIKYRNKIDFILIDTYSTLNFYYALIISQLGRWFNLPYIPVLRGGHLPHRLKTHPRLCRMLFGNAHVNVAPSRYLKDAFEGEGYAHVVYIPNTISIKDYPFKTRAFEHPKLLWVRSFSNSYNPSRAVEVLNALQATGLDASLCMVGLDADGTLKDVTALAEDLNVEVTFTGKLPKQDWVRLAEDYNIFINTTTIDNTPVSVIEAMALGLPVVSTNVGGMPFLIKDKHHGLLVDSNAV